MRPSEAECLEALQEAADVLGESPTKQQYEELGLTPAASTILRVIGGWNEAKERAGVETAPSTGSRVRPKPDDVDLPAGMVWEELSQDQRWHYKNVKQHTERTLRRRARLRRWVTARKARLGCREWVNPIPHVSTFIIVRMGTRSGTLRNSSDTATRRSHSERRWTIARSAVPTATVNRTATPGRLQQLRRVP